MPNHSVATHELTPPPTTPSFESSGRSIPKIDSPLTHFEVLFSIYAILFYTELWWALTSTLGPVILLIRYSILGISLILLSLRAKTLIRILPQGKWFWAYCLVCALSIVWSIDFGLTSLGILQILLQVSVFGLYFTSRFSPKHQLYILASALAITILVNLFYVVAIPSIGIHTNDKFEGAWKGFYANKNEFSGVMLWSLAVFYLLSFKNNNRLTAWLARIGLFISPVLVILSTSKTALILFILLCVSLTAWSKYRWKGRKTILALDLALFSTLILLGGIITQWVTIVSGLGKDPTLSGRTIIWSAAIEQISQKPLLGYGFAAFWTEDNPAARRIGDALYPGFYTYHSHNGLLDILLNVGWIGLIVFMVGFISTWVLALKYAYKPESSGDSWPLAVMVVVTLYNTTESTFITDNINWLLYVMAYLSVRTWPRQPAPVRAAEPATPALLSSTADDGSY